MDFVTLVWLVVGLAMMGLELFVPGLVIIFMGAAAVLVAGLRWLGLVESLPFSLAAWMGLSVGLAFALRGLLQRWLPSESRRDLIGDDTVALDQVVQVVVACDSQTDVGRIRYQGTTWPARTVSGRIEAGESARLLYRDNLRWVIEPLSPALHAELAALDDG